MFSIFVDLGDLHTNFVTLNKIGKLLSCSFPFFYFFGFLTNANRYQLRYFKLLFKGHCLLKFWFFDLIQFSESLDCAIVKIYQTLLFISRLDPGQYFAGLFVILNKNKIKKLRSVFPSRTYNLFDGNSRTDLFYQAKMIHLKESRFFHTSI